MSYDVIGDVDVRGRWRDSDDVTKCVPKKCEKIFFFLIH